MSKNDTLQDDAISYIDSFLTPEEIAESNLRVALIGELIKARNERGVTQKQLEEMSGVSRPSSHAWSAARRVRTSRP